MQRTSQILILGAGTGGVAVASRLRRIDRHVPITVVDPAEFHYYQPFWTLVGAGIGTRESTGRRIADLLPSGVRHVQDSVAAIHPERKQVSLKSGQTLSYDYLVVATGLKLDWNKIEGMDASRLGKNGVCSIYDYATLEDTTRSIQSLDKGRAIFVMPPVPIKCAGAPQKIMYLAEHIWRKKGVRSHIEVVFATAGKAMFGIPTFAEPLKHIVEERGIIPKFQHKLAAVDTEKKIASFDVTLDDGALRRESMPYDLLHVVPPMSAHDFIAQSELAVQEGDQKGWLAVDKYSLQHLKYPNIFGIGDVTGVPNSKTGAAIRKQYPVVVENLLAVMEGRAPTASYDGYSSCPLITEMGKVMLAEFGYDSKLMPSFPLDPARPRRSYWHLKKDLLPRMYWHGMMKGIM
jgi:sulfide:quinone oxidoreductase